MFPAGSRYVPGRVPICSRPGPDFSRDLIGNISGFFGQNREHIGVFRDFLLSMRRRKGRIERKERERKGEKEKKRKEMEEREERNEE